MHACLCVQFDAQRTALSCKLFWKNAAHPAINTSRWTQEEDQTLLGLVVKYAGVNWDAMAAELQVLVLSAMPCLPQQANTKHLAVG